MAAPEPNAPESEQVDSSPPGMEVERVRLDDGRSLLLFTWDDSA